MLSEFYFKSHADICQRCDLPENWTVYTGALFTPSAEVRVVRALNKRLLEASSAPCDPDQDQTGSETGRIDEADPGLLLGADIACVGVSIVKIPEKRASSSLPGIPFRKLHLPGLPPDT